MKELCNDILTQIRHLEFSEEILKPVVMMHPTFNSPKMGSYILHRLLRGLASFTETTAINISTLLLAFLLESHQDGDLGEKWKKWTHFIEQLNKGGETKQEILARSRGILLVTRILLIGAQLLEREAELPWPEITKKALSIYFKCIPLRRLVRELLHYSPFTDLGSNGEDLSKVEARTYSIDSLDHKHRGSPTSVLDTSIFENNFLSLEQTLMAAVKKEDWENIRQTIEKAFSNTINKPKATNSLIKGLIYCLADIVPDENALFNALFCKINRKIPEGIDLTFLCNGMKSVCDTDDIASRVIMQLRSGYSSLAAVTMTLIKRNSRIRVFRKLFRLSRRKSLSLEILALFLSKCIRCDWWKKLGLQICSSLSGIVFSAKAFIEAGDNVKQSFLTILNHTMICSSHKHPFEVIENVVENLIEKIHNLPEPTLLAFQNAMEYFCNVSERPIKMAWQLCMLEIIVESSASQETIEDLKICSTDSDNSQRALFEVLIRWLSKPSYFFRTSATQIFKESKLLHSEIMLEAFERILLKSEENTASEEEFQAGAGEDSSEENASEEDMEPLSKRICHEIDAPRIEEQPLEEATDGDLRLMDFHLGNIIRLGQNKKRLAVESIRSSFHFQQRLLDWVEIVLENVNSLATACHYTSILIHAYFINSPSGQDRLKKETSIKLSSELQPRLKKLLSKAKSAVVLHLGSQCYSTSSITTDNILNILTEACKTIRCKRLSRIDDAIGNIFVVLMQGLNILQISSSVLDALWTQWILEEKIQHGSGLFTLLSKVIQADPNILAVSSKMPTFFTGIVHLRSRAFNKITQLFGCALQKCQNGLLIQYITEKILDAFADKVCGSIVNVSQLRENMSSLFSFLNRLKLNPELAAHSGHITDVLVLLKTKIEKLLSESKIDNNQARSLYSRISSIAADLRLLLPSPLHKVGS